jgi:hypothetical protein
MQAQRFNLHEMEVLEQKVLRFDVDGLAFDPAVLLLSENIILKFEVSCSHKDTNLILLTLIWKIHYMDMEDNELLGLLITHDHFINKSEINFTKMKRIILLSSLNARQKIEDRVSADFLLNSNFDNLDVKLFTSNVILVLSAT